jgi:hypothetical protein
MWNRSAGRDTLSNDLSGRRWGVLGRFVPAKVQFLNLADGFSAIHALKVGHDRRAAATAAACEGKRRKRHQHRDEPRTAGHRHLARSLYR